MPRALSASTAMLLDSWGRANRSLEDRVCPNCLNPFRPKGAPSRYCSRICQWANNGGHSHGRAKPAVLNAAFIERNSIPEPNSGCWIWLNATAKGYAVIKIRGQKRQNAHRASFSIFCREPLSSNDIDHKCRNILCVNPDHLEEVTHKINCERRNAARAALKLASAS